MMEYKGYIAKIEFDAEANLFHGQVINMRDVITFQGHSVEELRREFAESVEDYLEFCAERGEEPEKPFSGKFLVRTDPTLHREISIVASRENQSINAWINKVLQQAVHARPAGQHVTAHYEDIQHIYKRIVETAQISSQSSYSMSTGDTTSIRKSVVSSGGNVIPFTKLPASLEELDEGFAYAC